MTGLEGCLYTLAAVAVVLILVFVLLTGGKFGRLGLGYRAFRRTLGDADFAGKIEGLLDTTETKPSGPPKPSGAPLRMLAVLQREGRLLDFLLEDIKGYADDQVGAAVRDIHRQCQAALNEHLALEPVLPKEEGADIEVPPGFNPAAIRLTGNVTGQPPFKGKLRHHGWRVKEIKLAAPHEGQDEFIVMPAEVELS
jgi:hypothetical protein